MFSVIGVSSSTTAFRAHFCSRVGAYCVCHWTYTTLARWEEKEGRGRCGDGRWLSTVNHRVCGGRGGRPVCVEVRRVSKHGVQSVHECSSMPAGARLAGVAWAGAGGRAGLEGAEAGAEETVDALAAGCCGLSVAAAGRPRLGA